MSYKELFILRHAKSSWDEPNKDDIDRALTTRGITDAYSIANRTKKKLHNVDLIISSHANRAIHTATIFAGVMDFSIEKLNLTSKIYEASEIQILQMIKEFSDDHKSILIVGHNPSFTYLANRFLKSSIDNLPTSGIVGLSFNSSTWKEIGKENLQSNFFEFPKKEQ